MSIFYPIFMKPNPFYPIWMGNVEIDVEVEVPSNIGGGGYEFNEYSSSEVLSLFVHTITFQQEKTKQIATKYISNIQIPKLKFIPKIKTVKVKFKKH